MLLVLRRTRDCVTPRVQLRTEYANAKPVCIIRMGGCRKYNTM